MLRGVRARNKSQNDKFRSAWLTTLSSLLVVGLLGNSGKSGQAWATEVDNADGRVVAGSKEQGSLQSKATTCAPKTWR